MLNKKVLDKLTNKTVSFRIFLVKPKANEERLKNINLITSVLEKLRGKRKGFVLDHNEQFDTITVFWSEDLLKSPFMIMHPMTFISKFYCVKAFRKA